MSKESFLMYKSFYAPIKDLSDEDAGKLFKSIYEYQLSGKECEHDGMVKMAFQFFKNQFDLDNKKYEKIVTRNKANGKKGGRPKSNPDNPLGFNKPKKTSQNPNNPNNPNEPKKADNDNDNDNETVNDNDNKKKTNDMKKKEKQINELSKFMDEKTRAESSSLFFIIKSLKSNFESGRDIDISPEAVFLGNKKLLSEVASLYTKDKKNIENAKKYQRLVEKGLTGQLKERWNVNAVIEEVLDFAHKKLQKIICDYSDLKSKQEYNEKLKFEKQQKETSLDIFNRMPTQKQNELEKRAIEIAQRNIGSFVKLEPSHAIVKSYIANLIQEEGYVLTNDSVPVF